MIVYAVQITDDLAHEGFPGIMSVWATRNLAEEFIETLEKERYTSYDVVPIQVGGVSTDIELIDYSSDG